MNARPDGPAWLSHIRQAVLLDENGEAFEHAVEMAYSWTAALRET
jgi:hypothetical protein